MLPFRKASVLQIWDLWGNFSQSPECTSDPYLSRPVSSEGSTRTRPAWELCFSPGPRRAPCPSWAAGQPVPSLDSLLLLTTARLDLRCASARGTCPAVTGQMLPDPGCCQQTRSALLPWVLRGHKHGLSSTFGSSSFARAPCPRCSLTASLGKDPGPAGAPRPMGGRYLAGTPGGAGLGN